MMAWCVEYVVLSDQIVSHTVMSGVDSIHSLNSLLIRRAIGAYDQLRITVIYSLWYVFVNL